MLGGLLALFAILNSQNVKVHLIATTVNLPLILVIVVCGLVGAGIGWLVSRRRARARAAAGPT